MVRSGILLHVYHLETKGWENFVWGDPSDDKFGTITQFVYCLLSIPSSEEVSSIVFSGYSTKDGLIEGAYTKQFLLNRISELNAFPSLKKRIDELSLHDYDVFVRRIHELVVGPLLKNTLDEVTHAAAFFNEAMPSDKVFQIAAASHAPRCLQSQLVARESGTIPIHQPWYVVASNVSFSGTTMEDVVVLEPPHRGDDPMASFTPTLASVIKPYFSLDTEKKQRLVKVIQNALSNPED